MRYLKIIVGIIGAIGLYYAFGFGEVLQSNVGEIHAWRKSDCLSITYNYYKGNDFLHPECNILFSDDNTTGYAAGEFPGLYWFVGNIWKITGYSEPIYRLVVFLFMITGFSAQFLLLRHLFKSSFISGAITLIVFSSPLLTGYGTSFITNMPSLSLAQIGAALIYFGYWKNNIKLTHAGVLSYALAALFKVTAFSTFLLILPLLAFYYYKKNKSFFISVIIGFGAIFWWYGVFEPSYTALHGGQYTYNQIWPIWKMDTEDIGKAITFFKEVTFNQLMSPLTWIILPLTTILAFLIKGKTGRFFKYYMGGLILGFGTYFMFWFNAVHLHDYYFINSLIVLAFSLTGGFYFVKDRFPQTFKSWVFKSFTSLFVLFALAYGINTYRLRHNDLLSFSQEFSDTFNHEKHAGYWWYFRANPPTKKTEGINVWLDEKGVPKDAILACISDPSFNIQLMRARRKGFTNFFMRNNPDTLKHYFNKGVDYIIATTPSDTAHYPGLIGEKIGEYNEVDVYKANK